MPVNHCELFANLVCRALFEYTQKIFTIRWIRRCSYQLRLETLISNAFAFHSKLKCLSEESETPTDKSEKQREDWKENQPNNVARRLSWLLVACVCLPAFLTQQN